MPAATVKDPIHLRYIIADIRVDSSQFRAIVRSFYKRRHSRDRRQLKTFWTSDKSLNFFFCYYCFFFFSVNCSVESTALRPDGFQKLARKPKSIPE